MATAYKYVEREAENQINWAEVGSNFSNMLNEEARVREEKKAAIDEATREYQKIVANVPVGENGEVNKVALAFADDLQQQMLMQETLLKSGQLKPSQYTLMRQNLVDGTDIGFSLYEEYQKEFSKKMALNSDDIPYGKRLSKVTLEMMENVEGFSNFTGARLVIDSATGNVAAAKMIKDPNNPDGPLIPDSNPANLMSVSNLRNRIRTTVTNFDVVGAAEDWTDRLAPDVRQAVTSMGTAYKSGTIEKVSTFVRKAGGLDGLTDEQIAKKAEELGVSVDDLKSISLFEEASDKWAKSQLQGGTYNGASVLLDFNKTTMDGEVYTTTYNPDDLLDENGKRKQNILFAKTENGRVVYELTEEQEANAERALKTQARMMLKEEGTVQVQRMKSSPDVSKQKYYKAERGLKKQGKALANTILNVYQGTEDQAQTSLDQLVGGNENIIDATRTNDGVTIIYKGKDGQPGEKRTIEFGNKTAEEFVISIYEDFGRGDKTFDDQTFKDAVIGAEIREDKGKSELDRDISSFVTQPVKVDPIEEAVNYIDNLTYDSKPDQTVGDVVNEVKSFVNKIPNLGGIQVEYDGSAGVNILDGETVIGNFLTNSKGLEQAIDALKNYAKSDKKLTETAAKKINIQSKGKGQAAGTVVTGDSNSEYN
jgi:hypothetical protein